MVVFGDAVAAAVRWRAQREGLQYHVVSYGGSGTVFTAGWLHRRYRVTTQGWHALLNHYAVPIDCGVPRLVMLADPPTAHASVSRRGLAENVTRHLHGGQYGQDQIAGMVEFFDRWTAAALAPPPGSPRTVLVKYEAIYNLLPAIGAALGVNMSGFPRAKSRRSQLPDTIDPRLLALRARFDELPAFHVS